jgi:hypothetical protein
MYRIKFRPNSLSYAVQKLTHVPKQVTVPKALVALTSRNFTNSTISSMKLFSAPKGFEKFNRGKDSKTNTTNKSENTSKSKEEKRSKFFDNGKKSSGGGPENNFEATRMLVAVAAVVLLSAFMIDDVKHGRYDIQVILNDKAYVVLLGK